MIHVRCHKCNKKYAVPDDAKGKRIRCRRCQQVIVVSEDVRDWLDAMSYAADKWQTDEFDDVAEGGSKPAPTAETGAAAINGTEDGALSAPGDNPVQTSTLPNASPPPAEIDPGPEPADQSTPAMDPAEAGIVPPAHHVGPITPRVMPLLMVQAFLTAFAVGAFLLVLGLCLAHGTASTGFRYVIAILAGFGSLAMLAAGLLLSWRVARLCQDSDRCR